MKKFSVGGLARIIGAEPASSVQASFDGVSTDSRTVKAGDCFFAIVGPNFDGHDYVGDAFAKGAVCAVVSEDIADARLAGKALLKVDDTVKALGDFTKQYRQQSRFKVVAITGSVGKTTTRQIVYHVLSQHYRVKQSPKSFNNNIGLPLTLLSAEADDDIVVCELGSNHPGEIAYLSGIAQPDIAVVTNVYPAHLEGFGDLQTIIHEKLSISEGLSRDGVLIINADIDELVRTCRVKGVPFCTFGKSAQADLRVTDISCFGLSSRFAIEGVQVHLPLPGPGNVENALAAWAVCSRFGLTIDQFSQAVKNLEGISMRAEPLHIGTLTVLNDCYNANPASMKNALDILTALRAHCDSNANRRLVFISGDMAELGPQSEPLHAELGAEIAKAGVHLLLAVGKFAEITAEAARKAAGHDLQTTCFSDTISACDSLHRFIREHDIILVKGSRTAKLEMAVEKLKELYAPAKVPYPIEELAPALPARQAANVDDRRLQKS